MMKNKAKHRKMKEKGYLIEQSPSKIGMRTIFKIICYLALMATACLITMKLIPKGPFFTALWLLFCLLAGGVLKPFVDRLARKIFGKR
jgi:hypothetical protein